MSIRFDTVEEFFDGVAEMVRHGLNFKAYRTALLIELTGGH